jgi:hypothetical protein
MYIQWNISLKKEGNCDICYMDEPLEYYTKSNKSDSQEDGYSMFLLR